MTFGYVYLNFKSVTRFGWILAPFSSRAERSLPNITSIANAGVLNIAGLRKTDANT